MKSFRESTALRSLFGPLMCGSRYSIRSLLPLRNTGSSNARSDPAPLRKISVQRSTFDVKRLNGHIPILMAGHKYKSRP